MNRRQFLKRYAATLALNFFPFNLLFAATPKSVVWEVLGTGEDSINTLFSSMGGIEKFIIRDISKTSVLIKPNLCLPHNARMGTITSPEVVGGLCRFLVGMGVKKIIIADHTLQSSKDFRSIELMEVLARYPEVNLILANEQGLYNQAEVNGKVLKTTEALKLLSQVDLFINMATAKHHSATKVSLAIKNLMGLIWNRTEFHTQLDLNLAIADLALAIRPDINIIDASRVLLNRGPTGPGPVINENRLFASLDILALDAVVTSRYKFGNKTLSARDVPHLLAAYQNGVGEIDAQNIQVKTIST